jgi:hypothetical protein
LITDVSQAVQIQLDSQLADIRNQFLDNSLRVTQLTHDLHHHQLNLRIESDKWSIAECIVHLNLFSETFVAEIRVACEKAQREEQFGGGPYKLDLIGRLLNYALEPPSKWTAVTPERFEPAVVEPLDEVIPTFLGLQQELTELITTCSGLDLNKIKITSPVSNHVRYNLYSCFQIIATHQRRHLWQAEQTRDFLHSNGMRR